METKTYNVILEEKDSKSILSFKIDSKDLHIDLNSEDQTSLRILFYEIIKLTFSEIPVFNLLYDSKTFTKQLFIDIASEYIKQLNNEVAKIIEQKPEIWLIIQSKLYWVFDIRLLHKYVSRVRKVL